MISAETQFINIVSETYNLHPEEIEASIQYWTDGFGYPCYSMSTKPERKAQEIRDLLLEQNIKCTTIGAYVKIFY